MSKQRREVVVEDMPMKNVMDRGFGEQCPMSLKVCVEYDEGHWSNARGGYTQRGYCLRSYPRGIVPNGFVVTIGSGPRGANIFLEPATRFNQRKLESIAAGIKGTPAWQAMLDSAALNRIEFAEEPAAVAVG